VENPGRKSWSGQRAANTLVACYQSPGCTRSRLLGVQGRATFGLECSAGNTRDFAGDERFACGRDRSRALHSVLLRRGVAVAHMAFCGVRSRDMWANQAGVP
jgi:hypothetical protein